MTMTMLNLPDSRPSSAYVPRDGRMVTLLLMGKLISEKGEALCRIRNLSSGGMMAEAQVPLQVDEPVQVRLNGVIHLSGTARWCRDGRVGLQFDGAVDVLALLRRAREAVAYDPSCRMPSFEMDCPVQLSIYGRAVAARLMQITQTGALLRADLRGRDGLLAVLDIPDLPSREGSLVQRSERIAELRFTEALAFTDLASWLAIRQWNITA
jgi:hypothetical protein